MVDAGNGFAFIGVPQSFKHLIMSVSSESISALRVPRPGHRGEQTGERPDPAAGVGDGAGKRLGAVQVPRLHDPAPKAGERPGLVVGIGDGMGEGLGVVEAGEA